MEDKLAKELWEAADVLGHPPTQTDILRMRREGVDVPPTTTLQRMGGMILALRQAGFSDNEIGEIRISQSKRYKDKEEIFRQLRELIRQLGRIPIDSDIVDAKQNGFLLPTRRTLGHHFGGLRGALEAAGALEQHYTSSLTRLAESGPVLPDGNSPGDYYELRLCLNSYDFAQSVVDTVDRLQPEKTADSKEWLAWFEMGKSHLRVELTEKMLVISRHRDRLKHDQPYYYLELPINIHNKWLLAKIAKNGTPIRAGGYADVNKFHEFTTYKFGGEYPTQIDEIIQISAKDVLTVRRGIKK